MKRSMVMTVVATLACVFAMTAGAIDKDAVGKAFEYAAGYEFGASREPLTVISDAVRDSQGDSDARAWLEKTLVGLLRGKSSRDAKDFACRQLAIIGTDATVPMLASMLGPADTSDMARYALERIPGPAADKALLSALGRTSGKAKVGVINSLGARASAEAVDKLASLAKSSDAAVAGAAMAALGKIANGPACTALAAMGGKVNEQLHPTWADAYLLCADRAQAGGDSAKAAGMYAKMMEDGDLRVKVAAFVGYAKAAPTEAVPLVVQALMSDVPEMRAAAVTCVRQIPGPEVTGTFAKALPGLDPAGQAILLTALADRCDSAEALPAATAAVSSGDAAVRTAALEALGKLGNETSIPVLLKAAVSDVKQEAKVAGNSLDRLRGEKVNAAMVDALSGAAVAEQCELARSLAARSAVEAVPVLLKQAEAKDEAVRTSAFDALGSLASASDLPVLVDLLVGTDGDNARKAAEKAVASVAGQIEKPEERGVTVLAALKKARSADAKCSLYTVLGQIGDPNGLKPVSKAAKGGKQVTRDAAVRALAGWPTPAAVEDVMKIAAATKNETHKTLALRGLMSMLAMEGAGTLDERMGYYEKALKAASTPEQKKQVIGALGNVKSDQAVKLLEPYRADATLKEETEAAIKKIQEEVKK